MDATSSTQSSYQTAPTRREHYDADDVKRTADVTAMLTAISGEANRSRRWRCPTPEHADNDPSCAAFTADDGVTLWKCHGCGQTGSAIELGRLMQPALDDCELIDWVGRNYSGANPSDRRQATAARLAQPPRPIEPPKVRSAEYEKARRPDNGDEILTEYCAHRGWTLDTAISWRIEVVHGRRGVLAVRMPYRLDSRIVYWKDRFIGAEGAPLTKAEAKSRGLNAAHDNPGGSIPVPYGVDNLAANSSVGHSLFVVEGEADAISISEAIGMFTPVVAFPGASNATPRWIDAIDAWQTLDSSRRVFVVADNDDAGDRLRETLGARLTGAQHLHVPTRHNDVTAWLAATSGDAVADELRAQARSFAEVAA